MRTSAGPADIPTMPTGHGAWFGKVPATPPAPARQVSWPTPPEAPYGTPYEDTGTPPEAVTEVMPTVPADVPAEAVPEAVTDVVTRMTRDAWALGIAEAVKGIADCTRSQVGSVILNPQHRTIGLGYNGLPPGVPGCATAGNCPRGQLTQGECAPNSDYANCAATHSERNAIEDALARPGGAEALKTACLYVTREPCPACWTLILAVGIHRVVTPTTKYRKDLTA